MTPCHDDTPPPAGREGGAPAPLAVPSAAGRPPRISSAVLMGGGRDLIIEHDGTEYLLRITRFNKLILTK